MRFLICTFLFFSVCHLWGQPRKWDYQKKAHEWDHSFPDNLSSSLENKALGLVILDEHTEWRIYQHSLNTVIHRKQIIEINSEKGLNELLYIKLPPEIDPLWERDSIDQSRQVRYQKIPQLGGELIRLGLRKKTADGKLEEVPYRDSLVIRVQLNNSTKFKHFDWYIIPESLEVGDQLEIEYEVFFPFLVDRSNESNFTLEQDIYEASGLFDSYRIFFHGDLHKQRCSFELIIPSNEHYILFFDNDLADPAKKVTEQRPFDTKYFWEFENLPACMREVGIRPHHDLPYIQYYRHNRRYGKWSEYDILEYRPYDWRMQSFSKMRFKSDHKKMFGGISSKEKSLHKFYARVTAGLSDNESKLKALHNFINDELSYQDDGNWFKGIDNRLERMGSHMRKGVFREISRYDTYDGLLNRLGTDYYHSLASDNRIAKLSSEEWRPLLGSYQIYSVDLNNRMHFLFPKNKDNGWKLGELPFYLSGSTFWAVKQSAEDRFDPDNILFINSSVSAAYENYRKIEIDAIWDAEAGLLLDAVIDLSGQFSTMHRTAYLDERYVDQAVNPAYAQPLYALFPTTKLESHKVGKVNDEFPYDVRIESSYFVNDWQVINTDSTVEIALENLFPHILEWETDEYRDLPYYPDFPQADQICYTFHLPAAAKITSFPTLAMSGKEWSYDFSGKMEDPTTLKICSRLLLDREKLKAVEFAKWREVMSFLELLGEEKLVLTYFGN